MLVGLVWTALFSYELASHAVAQEAAAPGGSIHLPLVRREVRREVRRPQVERRAGGSAAIGLGDYLDV